MKPAVAMLSAVACVVLFVPLCAVGLDAPATVSGDAEMAALKGISGTGAESDPFVIEGMHFRGGAGSPLLALHDVTAHTIIVDCTFVGAEGVALDLQACGNVWILSCVFADNALAVSVSGDCSDVVIALNTFERNTKDVFGDAASVRLDDEYVGNWWDGNATFDMNGDGLSEIPYFVCAGEHPLLDMHSLVFPYAGDHSDEEEGTRLEMRFSLDDSDRMLARVETQLTIEMDETSSCTALMQDLEFVVRVRSAPGTGYAEVVSEVTGDSGSVRVDDQAYDYDNIRGSFYIVEGYRFGSPGLSAILRTGGDDALPVGIQPSYAAYPVRPIVVGHAWTSLLHPDPTDSGFSRGTLTTEMSRVLARLDELRGVPCAVIKGQSMTTADGYIASAFLGSDVHMIGSVDEEIMIWVSLSTGRTVRSITSTTSSFESFVDDEYFMTVKYDMHIETDLYDDL